MSEYGQVIEPGTVRLQRLLPGPMERVWSYLTEGDKRAKWLGGGEMECRSGGAYELRFRHADLSPVQEPTPARFEAMADGVVTHGQVTECEPPTRLSITWPEGSGPDSHVTSELVPKGERVLLTVTHRRLPNRSAMLSVSSGWHAHLAILIEHLEGRGPPPFWSTYAALERAYDARLPGASCDPH
jgi:uncharacterized protein YndB with AHSA1/START domain